MATQPLVSIKAISKSFDGIKALDNVDIEINSGEVHCLAGENGSGKSTLIKCLSGVQPFDEGELYIQGKRFHSINTKEAIDAGIIVIYQDLSLFPNLTVAENIAMNSMVNNPFKLVNIKDNEKIAKIELEKLKANIDCKEYVENLSIAEKQIVAIARAMCMDAKLIVMDEPTTALTKKEVDCLLSIVLELKAKGISIIFVSHKLDEVFQISDNITVLRDGVKVGDFEASNINEDKLSYYMTGREIEYKQFQPNVKSNQKPIIELKNLTKKGMYDSVCFSVKPGEIVGVTGLLGSGRTELALSLFGLNIPDSGEILFEGESVNITSPLQAIELGIGLLPEDRHIQGLFNMQSISVNISSSILHRLVKKNKVIDKSQMNAVIKKWFDELKIKAATIENPPTSLSGGNQQRVVLAKWLATEPKLLILDSPTVGIDVGSKSEIHEFIHMLANQGMAIIIISDEIKEIYKNSNKILIMHEGKIVAEKNTFETDESELKLLVNNGGESYGE